MTKVRKFTLEQYQAFLNENLEKSHRIEVRGPEDAEIYMTDDGSVRVSQDVSIVKFNGVEITPRGFKKLLTEVYGKLSAVQKAQRVSRVFQLISRRNLITGRL